MIAETDGVVVEETGVLEKFNGEPSPENLVQRVHVKNGCVIKVEDFEDGQLVKEHVREVD